MGIFKVKGSPHYHFAFMHRGDRFRGSTGCQKKADAETYYARERRKAILGESDDSTLTLLEAFDRYEEEHAMFLASYNGVQAHVNHIMDYFGDGKPLHTIDQNELERYIAKCRTETYARKVGGKVKKLTNAAINRRIATFQGMHRRARDSWKIKVQPIDFKALRLKEKTIINNTLASKDVQTLWDAAPEHLQHFIMISLSTGWRMSNVLSLRGEQIDLITLTMQTVGKRGKLISSPISEAFEQYIRTNSLHEKDFVCAYNGQPVRRIKTAWNALFKRTKIKRVRIHDLRHTFGTWLYEQTGDQRLVQEMLHHSDIKTSMRYTHTKQELQREKLNKAMTLKIKQVAIILPKKNATNK